MIAYAQMDPPRGLVFIVTVESRGVAMMKRLDEIGRYFGSHPKLLAIADGDSEEWARLCNRFNASKAKMSGFRSTKGQVQTFYPTPDLMASLATYTEDDTHVDEP